LEFIPTDLATPQSPKYFEKKDWTQPKLHSKFHRNILSRSLDASNIPSPCILLALISMPIRWMSILSICQVSKFITNSQNCVVKLCCIPISQNQFDQLS